MAFILYMRINKVNIHGFMSFHDFHIDLSKTENIIVGTNGSGKTNFLDIVSRVVNSLCDNTESFITEISDTHNNFVKIHIEFDENELILLHSLFVFCVLCNYFQIGVKYEKLVASLYDLNIFSEGIIILCTQQSKCITQIKFNCCDCINANLSFNNHNSSCCLINQLITHIQLLSNIATTTNIPISQIFSDDFKIKFNINPDQINNFIIEHYFCDDAYKILQKCTDKKIFFKEMIKPLINNPNYKNKTFFDLFNEYANLKTEYYNDDSEHIITYYNCSDYINNISLNTFYNILPKYLADSVQYLSQNTYNNVENILGNVIDYEKQLNIIQCNISTPTSRILESNDILQNFIENINEQYSIRKKLFELKNNETEQFKNIQNKFKEIQGKFFDVMAYNVRNFIDYDYVIINDNNKYNCSFGETELIDFLCGYYSDSYASIILVDEPCSHLSSQNKAILRELFRKTNKQLIIVTHDIELIDKDHNLIYFNMIDGISMSVNLNTLSNKQHEKERNEENEKIKKKIFEHREILFSSQILFVEGYHDYKFIKVFLNYVECSKYNIIILDGCRNNIWSMCDKLKIKYKIIYDFDVLQSNIKIEQYYNPHAQHFLADHNILLENNQPMYITHEMLCSYLNTPKRKFIHTYIFLITIDKLLFNNQLNIDGTQIIKFKIDTNKKILTNDINKIIDNKNNMKNDVLCLIFVDILNDNVQEYLKKYEDSDEKRNFIKNHGDDFSHDFAKIFNEHNKSSLQLNTIVDNYLIKQNIFAWSYELKDLEGLGKKIYNDNNFKKSDWHTKTTDDIKKCIENYNADGTLIKLKSFLIN